MTSYPQRNPFPYQGTVSIEGTSLEPSEDLGDQTTPTQPTLVLNPIRQTRTKVAQYLARYEVGKQELGQMIVLSGEHGSGKTHAIRYVMKMVASGSIAEKTSGSIAEKTSDSNFSQSASEQSTIEPPLQLYAKAEGPDFLKVYQQIMTTVPLPVLRELSRRFFAVLAGEQVGVDRNDTATGRAAAEKFRLDPGQVDELFKGYSVDKGAVHERQTEEVDRVAGGIDDFKKAMYYLLTDKLSVEAYNWITRQPLREGSDRKLGVSGEINSPDVAKWGLQLLAAVFRRAGRPLIIYIDQYEKLVVDNRGELISPQNAGLLHSLVEVIPRESGTLVLAGNRDAWEALARDLKQRFAFNVVEFSVLKPSDALAMIMIYLFPTAAPDILLRDVRSIDQALASDSTTGGAGTASGADAAGSDLERRLYPFKLSAVREIVRVSGGNPRRLLQTCSAAFDAAFPDKRQIDLNLAEQILRSSPQIYFDSEQVRIAIRRLLNSNALAFEESFAVQDVRVDFAVLDQQQTPRLIIKLTEAMFYDDEARRALEHYNLIERIRALGWPAACAFVVLGYVSPEIIETVVRFAPVYIVYHPETFERKFQPILATTREAIASASRQDSEGKTEVPAGPSSTSPGAIGPPGPQGPPGAPDPRTLEELNSIKEELKALQAKRNAEAEAVQEQLKLLLQAQTAGLTERRQTGRLAWAEERRKIEAEMEQARQGRRIIEFDEMERLCAKAENEYKLAHRKKYLVRAAVTFAVMFVLSTVVTLFARNSSVSQYDNTWKFYVENWLSISFALSLLAATPFVLKAFDLFGRKALTELYAELSSPVGSLRELDQIIRGIPEDRIFSGMLKDKNPHFRYLAARHLSPGQSTKKIWVDALLEERAAIVRRVIAQAIGAERLDVATDSMMSIPEWPYIVEGGVDITLDYGRRKTLVRTLASLSEGEVAGAIKWLELSTDTNLREDLLEALKLGLDRYAPSRLADLSTFDIREALRRFSPFEDGGMGTFDELKCIDKIDQLYLFFRQLQFYLDRDLISSSAPIAEAT